MQNPAKYLSKLLPIVAVAVLLAGAFLSGCKKNTECTAVVTVLDSATGNPVSGASVRLYASISKSGYSNLEETSTTDGSGKVTMVFKLQAIFDIDVTKGGVTKAKRGVIKLEPGQTVEKDVRF